MTPAILHAVRKLIELIERDTASGLLNRDTIKAKNDLRLALSRARIRVDDNGRAA